VRAVVQSCETRHHYIRSLAPLGQPAPAFLPSDQIPPRPFTQLPVMS
jgi:hypothetical protein